MLVHVKTHRTKINIEGEVSPDLLSLLKKEYGKSLRIKKESDDEYIDIIDTDWYKNIKAGLTPGKNMKIYRINRGMTQDQLGQLLGGIPRQHISNMENGSRPISKKNAKELAKIFKVSIEKFI